MSCVDQFDWFPKSVTGRGLDEAASGTREDYRGSLREINGDSPLTQPQLKVEVWIRVADKQLAGRGYDGCVVRAEG